MYTKCRELRVFQGLPQNEIIRTKVSHKTMIFGQGLPQSDLIRAKVSRKMKIFPKVSREMKVLKK